MDKINKDIFINEVERIDDLHRNGLMLIQNPNKFCFGIDAVLLSDFVVVKKNETALDLGTGTGVIPILLTAKNSGKKYIGLEIQESLVEMARRSVALNELQDIITIDLGDIMELQNIYKPATFDVITINPPYMNCGGGLVNKSDSITISRHEILCNLEHIISGSAKVIKTNGHFYMIHRPHRLGDIMYTLRQNKLEAKKIRFVHPYRDKEPTMVLIEAVKNGRPMLKVLPPLFIYNGSGKYTDEITKIYYE